MKLFAILLAALIVWFLSIAAKDDTDPPGMGQRSGMKLFVDHRTGCHYLGNVLGGITPRVDGAGRHVGCER